MVKITRRIPRAPLTVPKSDTAPVAEKSNGVPSESPDPQLPTWKPSEGLLRNNLKPFVHLARNLYPTSFEDWLPDSLKKMSTAMHAHWSFLYDRAQRVKDKDAPPPVEFTRRRMAANSEVIEAGLTALRDKGHVPGNGKALVFSGYEVDLTPLLETFAEVEIVDLCDTPLEQIRNRYPNHREKIRCIRADVSGVPSGLQENLVTSLVSSGEGLPPVALVENALVQSAKSLQSLPFETGQYSFVVSPVLHESLPLTAVVTALEEARAKSGNRRRTVDEAYGELFYYRQDIQDAFRSFFDFHLKEMRRMVGTEGVAVFSSWMRYDEKNLDGDNPLYRVGDFRMNPQIYEDTLREHWPNASQVNRFQIYGTLMPSILNTYVLR